MGVLGRVGRKLGIGGTTLEVLDSLDNNPEIIAATAGGAVAGGAAVPLIGRLLSRGRKRAPKHVAPSPVVPVGLGTPPSHGLMALINAMNVTGQAVEGLQPWHVSGYKNIASATSAAKDSDLTDMFTSANTRLFSADDTFPWTFLCQRFRAAIVTEPVSPGAEDAAWDRQLSLRFVVATEVGRISIQAMGTEFIIQGPLSGSGGGTASQIFPNQGVGFPVIFEKNGTYQMFLHTDASIAATTKALSFSYTMDGWVVQNTGLLSDGKQITNALANLLGTSTNEVLAALSARTGYAVDDDDDDDPTWRPPRGGLGRFGGLFNR